MSVNGVGNQVTLQQFVTENPGAEGLAKVMQSKGLSDDQIVAMLAKSKDGWGELSKIIVKLPDPGDTKPLGEVSNVLGSMSSVELHADIFTFMALFQKMAQDMRQTARLDREMQLQANVSSLQAAADQIKAAAQERFSAALTQGICQIGAGAIQIGGAAAAGAKLKGASGDGAALKIQQATNLTTGTGGAGQIMQGVGTIVSGSFELKAGEADAKGKKLEAQSKIEEEARSKANDIMQQMQDVIRDIRDKLGAIQQSNIETNRGIARNI
jgi:hypothetical protein